MARGEIESQPIAPRVGASELEYRQIDERRGALRRRCSQQMEMELNAAAECAELALSLSEDRFGKAPSLAQRNGAPTTRHVANDPDCPIHEQNREEIGMPASAASEETRTRSLRSLAGAIHAAGDSESPSPVEVSSSYASAIA
jgi:hypothetical protein